MTISWNGPTGFTPLNLCDGVYQFNITDAAGCTVSGVVTLVDPPIPVAGPIAALDTICWHSTSETYSIPVQPNYTYQWSSVGTIISGQGSSTINVDWSALNGGYIPGAVQVTGFDINGCPSLPVDVDIEILNILPVIQPVGPFCSYDEFVGLQATPIGGAFTGVGVIDPNFTPGDAIGTNTITYTYTQSGCVFDTVTQVTVYPQPTISPITPYNEFYEICDGDSVVSTYSVVADLPGYNEWSFMNNTTQQDELTVTWNAAGMFDISVVHWSNGCVSSPQTTAITIVQCPSELFYIPNGFTPDGDEHNNTLRFVVGDAFDRFDFAVVIYNRWGEVVYESHDATAEWDGTYNNAMCQAGTYIYYIQLKHKETSKRYAFNGHVTLLK
jgi:gliding motility-associated-like protein